MLSRTPLPILLAVLMVMLLAVAGADAQTGGGSQAEEPAFPVGELNAGLPELEVPHVRETPRAAMEFLLDSVDRGDNLAAAHILNLDHLPVEVQRVRGPELARKLVYLLESQSLINWDRLPDLPDARVMPQRETVDSSVSQPYPRRSILLGSITLEGRPVPIQLQRFRLESGPLVWAFSPFAVDRIDRLYEQHGPGRLERHFPDRSEWGALGSVAVWELVVIAALVGSALALYWLLHKVMSLAARLVNPDWPGSTFSSCLRPVSWLITTCLLLAAARYLLPLDGTLTTHVDVVLVGAIFLLATWAVSRVATAVTISLARRGPAADPDGEQLARTYQTNIAVARRVVLFLAAVVGVGVLLSYLGVFDSIGMSLLASTGAFAVILGLAARPVLSGIVESVQIALTKPIEIGDVVEIDGYWGRIEDIRFMYSVLRDWTQKRIIIPHSHLLTTPFENWSKKDMTITRIIEVPIDLATDVASLREFFDGLMRDDPRWTDDERRLNVVEITSDAIKVWVWVTARNSMESWYLAADVREALVGWLQQREGRYLPHERHIVTRSLPSPGADEGEGESGSEPEPEPEEQVRSAAAGSDR